MDTFQFLTCANTFPHSSNQCNQELATLSFPVKNQISESSKLSMKYKLANGQELSKIPRLNASLRHHQCMSCLKQIGTVEEEQKSPSFFPELLGWLHQDRQLGSWGEPPQPVFLSYPRLPLLRFITWLSLTTKTLNLLERNHNNTVMTTDLSKQAASCLKYLIWL